VRLLPSGPYSAITARESPTLATKAVRPLIMQVTAVVPLMESSTVLSCSCLLVSSMASRKATSWSSCSRACSERFRGICNSLGGQESHLARPHRSATFLAENQI